MSETPDELFSEYTTWAKRVANKFCKKNRLPAFPCAEVHNAALVGLWDAANKYNPAQGVQFTTFAFLRVVGEMQDELRRGDWISRRAVRYRSGNATIPKQFHLGALVNEDGETFETPCLGFIEKPAWVDKEHLLALFDGRDKEIVQLYFFDGVPLHEIGERYGLTESWACLQVKDALAEARRKVRLAKQLGKETGMEESVTEQAPVASALPATRKHYFAHQKKEIVERILRRVANHEIVTQEEGCREEGINCTMYYLWKKKLGITDKNFAARTVKSGQVPVPPPSPRVETIADAIAVIKAACRSCVIVVREGNALHMEFKGDEIELATLKAHMEVQERANRTSDARPFEGVKPE